MGKMASRRRGRRWLTAAAGGLLSLGMLALARPGVAVETGTYTPPSLEGFVIAHEYDADGDGDGVNETRVKQYRNMVGDSVFSMTTSGSLWAWSLDTAGEDSNPALNYVIRDSDCDGVFDERYTLDEQFRVPDCLESPPPPAKTKGT